MRPLTDAEMVEVAGDPQIVNLRKAIAFLKNKQAQTMATVKVQIPLATNNACHPGALVYAQGRVNMIEQPIPDVVRQSLGAALKGYFKAEFDGRMWKIGERVKDETW